MTNTDKIIHVLMEQDTIALKFKDGMTMSDLASAFDVDIAIIESIIRNKLRTT